MADGGIILDDPTLDIPLEPVAARGLTYPLGAIPEPGKAIEAAPGVLWLRMPLPMALNHVNVYAITDGDGWAVIDTGLRTADTLPVCYQP